jgi:asparagine synthase (glutamine-hydrolysing)
MTHFDFKCLLPALLHVEDRMSMAHGLESRVPFLDHHLVEFVAHVPADVKFRDGKMKHLLKTTFAADLPEGIVGRRDKMGFPVPIKEWFSGPLRPMILDIFNSSRAQRHDLIHADSVIAGLEHGSRFSRATWGLLSLELWHQTFHDRAGVYRRMMEDEGE